MSNSLPCKSAFWPPNPAFGEPRYWGLMVIAHRTSSLNENGQLNFNDPSAVMQLTKALLSKDFGLKIELPDDRLCPPVR